VQRESRAPTRRIKKPGEDTARELYRANEWGVKKALPIRNPRKSKGTERCQETKEQVFGWVGLYMHVCIKNEKGR